MKNTKVDLTNPAILEELWETATFDDAVYQLVEQYTAAKEANKLDSDSEEIHQLAADIYHHLTTTRNRNLITHDEQQVLRQATGGFFGMSTGSHAVTTWIMESRANNVKIIDPDTISPSNLNRMRFGWDDIGKEKVEAVRHELSNISPYTNVISSTETTVEAQAKLFVDSPKIDFVIEAIDDLAGKIHLRKLAKQHKLPLLMATDVGDNVILDVERYDHTTQPDFFNGRIKDIDTIDFENLSMQQRVQLAMQIVGFEHNSEAMLQSLLSIGKKIGTWPQLGATATMAGAIITTTMKKILLGEKVDSGRYYFSADGILVEDYESDENQAQRAKTIAAIEERFGSK